MTWLVHRDRSEGRGSAWPSRPETFDQLLTPVEAAMSGKHNDVKVDPVSLRQLIAWVDANCPYRGDDDVRALPDPSFARIEELPIRPRIRTAPRIARP